MLVNGLTLGFPYFSSGLTPLSMPAGAEAIYSVWQVDGYSGNCCQVTRASDSTSQNIGFVDNYWDTSTLGAFLSGTTIESITWYDQSGNGRNATQTTASDCPQYRSDKGWGTGQAVNGLTFTADELDIPSTVSVDRQNCTVYCAFAPQASTPSKAVWGMNTVFTSGIALAPRSDATTQVVGNAFRGFSGIYAPSQPQITTVVASSSDIRLQQNEETQTHVALGTGTSNGGFIGKLNTAGWDYYGEVFFWASYAAQHDASTVQTVHNQIYTRLNINNNKRKRILFVGDSLTWGQDSGGIPYSRRLELLLNDPLIEIRNVGLPGQAVGGTDGMFDELTSNIVNSYREDYMNYLILWGGTNDIFLSSATGSTVYGAGSPSASGLYGIVEQAQNAGYRVALSNCIARAGTAGKKTEQGNLNTLIAANTASANRLNDLEATFNDETDTNLYDPDQIHLNENGYQTLAELIDSDVASDLTDEAPPQVTGLTLYKDNNRIMAFWSKPFVWGPTATYTVEYKESASGTWLTAATGVAVTEYQITGLTNGVEYNVRVTAVNTAGAGTPSATATVTVNPFAYSDISGLQEELNGNSGVSLTGGNVDSWTGTVNGYSLTATGAQRPSTRTVSGQTFLDFDGANEYMDGLADLYSLPAGNNTVVEVYKLDNASANQRLIQGFVSGGFRFGGYASNAANTVAGVNNSAFVPVAKSITPDTNVHVRISVRNGSTLSVYYDGGTPATGAATNVTVDQIRLGASGSATEKLDGAYGLCLFYNAALSAAHLNAIGAKLEDDYGITWTTVT